MHAFYFMLPAFGFNDENSSKKFTIVLPEVSHLRIDNCPRFTEYSSPSDALNNKLQAARVAFVPGSRGLKRYLKALPTYSSFKSELPFLLPSSLKTLHLTYRGGTKEAVGIINPFLLLAMFRAAYHPDLNGGTGALEEIIFEGPGCFVLPHTLTQLREYVERKQWELEYRSIMIRSSNPLVAKRLQCGGMHIPSLLKFIGTKGELSLRSSSVLELRIDATTGTITQKTYRLKRGKQT